MTNNNENSTNNNCNRMNKNNLSNYGPSNYSKYNYRRRSQRIKNRNDDKKELDIDENENENKMDVGEAEKQDDDLFQIPQILSAKQLMKELESNVLQRVDVDEVGIKKNQWYIYMDRDNNGQEKFWVNYSLQDHAPTVNLF